MAWAHICFCLVQARVFLDLATGSLQKRIWISKKLIWIVQYSPVSLYRGKIWHHDSNSAAVTYALSNSEIVPTNDTQYLAHTGQLCGIYCDGFRFFENIDRILTALHCIHDDVIKWKHLPRYWPFVRGIHRSPMNPPHTGQLREALMFSLICVWTNGWVNNREAGDLRRYHVHYDVTVISYTWCPSG